MLWANGQVMLSCGSVMGVLRPSPWELLCCVRTMAALSGPSLQLQVLSAEAQLGLCGTDFTLHCRDLR